MDEVTRYKSLQKENQMLRRALIQTTPAELAKRIEPHLPYPLATSLEQIAELCLRILRHRAGINGEEV